MIRHLCIFIIAAGFGAVLALIVRSTMHRPYVAPAMDAATPTTPAVTPSSEPKAEHAGYATTPAAKPVNAICAICGMDANPKLTATYREQVIAFGCVKCPPQFTKEPERYGPYFLRNEEAP